MSGYPRISTDGQLHRRTSHDGGLYSTWEATGRSEIPQTATTREVIRLHGTCEEPGPDEVTGIL
jgi:hypothetical protein